MAKELRINERINARQVRLIRGNEQLGIVPIDEALRAAEDAGLDLVEISPNADPPVVKVMDYGKFKYEQSKKEREARKGSKQSELREVRMKVKIDQHDIDFKVRTARKLLAEGDKVKLSVMFRAREITHPEVGRELLDKFSRQLEDIAQVEKNPSMEGRFMTMIVGPKKGAAAQKKPAQPAAQRTAEQQPAGARS